MKRQNGRIIAGSRVYGFIVCHGQAGVVESVNPHRRDAVVLFDRADHHGYRRFTVPMVYLVDAEALKSLRL